MAKLSLFSASVCVDCCRLIVAPPAPTCATNATDTKGFIEVVVWLPRDLKKFGPENLRDLLMKLRMLISGAKTADEDASSSSSSPSLSSSSSPSFSPPFLLFFLVFFLPPPSSSSTQLGGKSSLSSSLSSSSSSSSSLPSSSSTLL